MRRRQVMGGLATALALPAVAQPQKNRVLRFVPDADLAIVDPMITTSYQTRDHGFMVFDSLYGQDNDYRVRPQMVEGHVIEDDGKTWKLTLRDGLRFHDGQPVLARDAVASINRWGKRDSFGQALLAAVHELDAPDDKTIRFRLRQPFPLLADALGHYSPNMLPIMPQRLAETDPSKQITEMVGSGPFRFKADERVPGSRVVYEKFADYVPRNEPAERTVGGKLVHFDRVEWLLIPDVSAAANALAQGEVDWLGTATADLRPVLQRARGVTMLTLIPTGTIATMRFNQLIPPFDNPAIRRAIVHAVTQSDYMTAIQGDDRTTWRDGVGFFCPDTPMASAAGMENLTGPRDLAAVKRELAEAGYKGEKLVLLAPQDIPSTKAIAEVTFDLFKRLGLNVEAQAMDWATLVQRRTKQEPVEQGGWNVFHTSWGGVDQFNPAVHAFLRGNGKSGIMGWPVSPTIEALRAEWLVAPDLAAQKQVCETMQEQAFKDVPYIPLGQVRAQSVHRSDLQGVLTGLPVFWNVRRA